MLCKIITFLISLTWLYSAILDRFLSFRVGERAFWDWFFHKCCSVFRGSRLNPGSRWTSSGVLLWPWCSFADQTCAISWVSVCRMALWVFTLKHQKCLMFYCSSCWQRLCFVQICSLMRGGIAERGGVRVGHRIIEINGQSVVATPHEKIVHILSNAVGEVNDHLSVNSFPTKHWIFCVFTVIH